MFGGSFFKNYFSCETDFSSLFARCNYMTNATQNHMYRNVQFTVLYFEHCMDLHSQQ